MPTTSSARSAPRRRGAPRRSPSLTSARALPSRPRRPTRSRPRSCSEEGAGMLGDSKAFSGFSVHDIESARSFYTDVLGLQVTEQNEILTLHLGGGTDVIAYPKGDAH